MAYWRLSDELTCVTTPTHLYQLLKQPWGLVTDDSAPARTRSLAFHKMFRAACLSRSAIFPQKGQLGVRTDKLFCTISPQ